MTGGHWAPCVCERRRKGRLLSPAEAELGAEVRESMDGGRGGRWRQRCSEEP